MGKIRRVCTPKNLHGVLLGMMGGLAATSHSTSLQPRHRHVQIEVRPEILRSLQSTPTLQVVVNPLLRRESPIHQRVFAALKDLQADHVRFVPWMPYPRLGVAELEPPTHTRTYWDFSLIDPLVEDFFAATQDHSVVFNFSTIPQWMFKTDWYVWYPEDPNTETWSYEQGTELRDPSLGELAGYYKRLAEWYMKGGFFDELGAWHHSPHRFKVKTWEIFNEVDVEHFMTPQQYTERYDAIVKSVREVDPSMEFMGLALMRPMELPHYFRYFLNPQNHDIGIPLDWISYHFYATAQVAEPLRSAEITFADEAQKFLNSVDKIEEIRKELSPQTKTNINEIGTMMAEDYTGDDATIRPDYWNLSGATFAYLFGELAKKGIEVITQSQLVGFPNQFPSVSMVNWDTGAPNARYWVLKLLIEHFSLGDEILYSSSSDAGLYTFAVRKADQRSTRILFANRRGSTATLDFGKTMHALAEVVSPSTGEQAPPQFFIDSHKMDIEPYAVGVLSVFENQLSLN